jgi:hypothetical protein
MTARCKFHTPPNRCWHNSVMYHMQCGHLIVPFAHDKEQCVKEFSELGEEVPPTSSCGLKELNQISYKFVVMRYTQNLYTVNLT